ncbi:hypothetical protein pb186bvf_012780 [Paramecium bursaria]
MLHNIIGNLRLQHCFIFKLIIPQKQCQIKCSIKLLDVIELFNDDNLRTPSEVFQKNINETNIYLI